MGRQNSSVGKKKKNTAQHYALYDTERVGLHSTKGTQKSHGVAQQRSGTSEKLIEMATR